MYLKAVETKRLTKEEITKAFGGRFSEGVTLRQFNGVSSKYLNCLPMLIN